MKKLWIGLALTGLFGCERDRVEADCVEKPRSTGCYAYYDPVCGCNHKTYGNACEAEAVGVRIVAKGLCPGR